MKPKVLIFDIETAPMIAYVWSRKDVNISVNQLKDEWYVLSWAAKWLGEKKVLYQDMRKGKTGDDKYVLEGIWSLLNEADVVITQNGKNFDSKKLNARFILNGMKPPSPYQHFDTYQLARRVAAFTSNSLEYLTEKLCTKYKKLSHKKFPGMELWKQCLAGNMKAWDEMRKYNIHDVLSTEELYLKIRSWAPASSPEVYGVNSTDGHCKICGLASLIKQGIRRRRTRLVQIYSCKSCGAWQ